MKSYKAVLTEVENGILLITINRPKALNALNSDVFEDLETIFSKDALEIEGLKGVVITGAGEKSFVAGADITQFPKLNQDNAAVLSKVGNDVFFSIERFHVPVIAAVNGFALGGGCELAMACHLRIAGEKARFGQPEVNLGLIPGYGGTQRLVQLIGKGKALELLMTADMVGAEEAHRLGLANHVVPAGEEVAKAKSIIEKIATKGGLAVTKIIETVNAYFDKTVDGFEKEVENFGVCMVTEEGREGVAAFLEKRKPNFKR